MRQILFQPVQFVDVVFESDVQITSMESGGGDGPSINNPKIVLIPTYRLEGAIYLQIHSIHSILSSTSIVTAQLVDG